MVLLNYKFLGSKRCRQPGVTTLCTRTMRISNFNSSNCSKYSSKNRFFSKLLFALYIDRTSSMASRFISCPNEYLYSRGNCRVTS